MFKKLKLLKSLRRLGADPLKAIKDIAALQPALSAKQRVQVIERLHGWMLESEEANIEARKIAKDLFNEFVLNSPPTCQAGDGFLFTNPALLRLVSNEELRNWFQSWTTRYFETLSGDDLAQYVKQLPRKLEFYPMWPWQLFDILAKNGDNRLALDAIPDVSVVPKARPARYQRLWSFLLKNGEHALLTQSIGTALERFDDRDIRSTALRLLGESGLVESLPVQLRLSDVEPVMEGLGNWVRSTDAELVLERSPALVELAVRLITMGAKREPIHEFARTLIEVSLRGYTPANCLSLKHLLAKQELEYIVPENVLRAEFQKFVSKILENLPGEHITAFVDQWRTPLSWFPEWPWVLFRLLTEKGHDVITLKAIPDVVDSEIQPQKHYRLIWSMLWDKGEYQQIAEIAGHIADRTLNLDSRLMQLRALLKLGEFAEIERLFTSQWGQSLEANHLDWLCRKLVDHLVMETCSAQETMVLLSRLSFLPLINKGRLTRIYRKSFHQHAGQLAERDVAQWVSTLPAVLPFDPDWPIFRTSELIKMGHWIEPEDLERIIGIIGQDSLSLTFVVNICQYFYNLNDFIRLRRWVEQGLRQASHARLLLLHALCCLDAGQPRLALESAEKLLALELISGKKRARTREIFLLALCEIQTKEGAEAVDVILQSLRSVFQEELPEHLEILVKLDRGEEHGFLELLQKTAHVADQEQAAVQELFSLLNTVSCDETKIKLLSSWDSHVRPTFWSIQLAQLLLQTKRVVDSLELINAVVAKEPDNQDAMRLQVRVLIALNRGESAIQICTKMLQRIPDDLTTARELVKVYRATKVPGSQVAAFIEKWSRDSTDVSQQCRIRVALLLAAALPHLAFLEAWDWFQKKHKNVLAARDLSKTLIALGELGLAEFFMKLASLWHANGMNKSTEGWLKRIHGLQQLLNVEPLTRESALALCAELSQRYSTGVVNENFVHPVEAKRRLKTPEALMELAVKIAPRPRSFAGPICIVTSSLGAGGAERQVAITAVGLTDRLGGADVEVLCGNLSDEHKTSFFLPRLREAGVHVQLAELLDDTSLPVADFGDVAATTSQLTDLLRLWPDSQGKQYIERYYRHLVETQPRVVQSWQDETSVFAGFAALLAGVPRIVLGGRSLSPDHREAKPKYLRAGYRLLLEFDHVLMTNNSRAGAIDYARWLDYPADKIAVIYNGFEFEEIDACLQVRETGAIKAELGIPAEAPILGAVFRMNEVKRPHFCLDIMLELLDLVPECYGVFVGDGPLWQEVSQRGLASRHAQRLRFPGLVNPVEPWMATMDMMLLTSRVEGLPNVLIEAQAVGTPVVSSNVGGAGEAFLAGESGLLLDTENPKEVAETIAAFLRDRGRLVKAGEIGRHFVRERFSVARMIQDTLAAFGDAHV